MTVVGRASGVLPSARRLGCAGTVKNLSFHLAADSRYWLQFAGTGWDRPEVMVSTPVKNPGAAAIPARLSSFWKGKP